MPERARRLHRASVELLGSLDLERVESEILRALKDILRADATAVMLKEPGTDDLVIRSHEGLSDEYARSQRVPFAAAAGSFHGPHDHVVLDLASEGHGDRKLAKAEGLATVFAIPLVSDGQFIGSLNAYMKDGAAEFNSQSVDLAHVLAVQASVAIGNAQTYQEAVHQRDLHQSILDALGEGVVIFYPPGVVGAFNRAAAELLGIGDEFTGADSVRWAELLQPRDALTGEPIPPSRTMGMRGLAGESASQEVVYRNVQTGEGRTVDVKSRPVRSSGKIVAAVATLYDLTEFRRLEHEKEQFLSVVSHELRTPLTPLKALAQLLIARIQRSRDKGQPLDIDSLQRNLASIERQVDRMNGLVTDLLSVSRAGRGKLEMDRAPFDLAMSVRDTVERYVEATREEGRHTFVVEAPAKLVVSADQSRIEQMLMNLIGNAVKYSPRGGEVRVELHKRDGEAEILICDQGIGIRAEDLDRLGEPFTRGTGKAASFAGMGIGLHVAKLMAQAHDGSLRLASDGEDRGTTVRVTLPV
jgi:signal transduction histidine kinase